MMGQFMMDLKNEPIQNLLRNMKSSFEYSLQHHHHHLIQAAAVATLVQTDLPEMALDLTKRRDSMESDIRKSCSFEELSNTRESPNSTDTLTQIHHHQNLSKLPTITPEHVTQYHYNYEHSPSKTAGKGKGILRSRSPLVTYEKFEELATVQKMEKFSTAHVENSSTKNFPIRSPTHYNHYPKLESSHHFHEAPPIIEHDDSNDIPSANISSSSSVASSQKSPSSSITSHATHSSMMVVTRDGKLSRPFKAYPRDPLSLASAGSILDGTSAEKYAVFRKRMLDQIHAANGGSVVVNNPKMRRISNKSLCEDTNNNNEPVFRDSGDDKTRVSGSDKDEAYFERRRKNNAAAKKSRDRRRIKEDEIAIRAAFLERENIELKFELAAARKQLAMYNNNHELKK